MNSTNKSIVEAYGEMARRSAAVELTEASLAHITGKKEDGYFIISACRGDWSDYEVSKLGGRESEEFKSLPADEQKRMLDNRYWNNVRTDELASDLRSLKYGYVPVYGGFKEKSDANPEGEDVFERSFFVPYQLKDKDSNEGFQKMANDIIALGKKYRQESVAICPPGDAPYFYVTTQYGNGDPVGTKQQYFGPDYKINDLTKEYFTSLNKVNSFDRGFDKANPHRYSFESTDRSVCESVTVNAAPMTWSGAYGRCASGEIFAPPYPSAKMAVV